MSYTEQQFTADALKAIAKGILYICLTIAFGLFVHTCKVDASTIQECDEACGSSGIHEVTAYSCECNDSINNETSQSPFVLPK